MIGGEIQNLQFSSHQRVEFNVEYNVVYFNPGLFQR